MSPLFALPVEILVQVLTQLSREDLAACRLCCRRLLYIISNSLLLQYLIRSLRSGVEPDLSILGLSLPDRVNALDRWERGWLWLDMLYHRATCPFDPHERIDYIVHDDLLIATRPSPTSLGPRPGYSYINLSSLRENAGHSLLQWTNFDFGPRVLPKEFSVAPQEDLVVVASARRYPYDLTLIFRFFKLSTGERHPMANREHIELCLEGNVWDCRISLKVSGYYVVLLITQMWDSRQCERLFFVNWKQGRISSLRHRRHPTYAPVLAFLDTHTILLAQEKEFALEICNLEDTSPPTLRTLCTLMLPPLSPQVFDVKITLQNAGSPPPWASPSSSKISSHLPFRVSSKYSVIGFSISLSCGSKRNGKTTQRNFLFWTHRRTLLKAAVAHVDVISWDDWGPEWTRWIERPMLSGRVPCMSSGERVALVRNAGHGEDQRALQVLDFNTARVRARREEEREQCENVISTSLYSITNPTVLRADAFLQHDIVSFLPYCCSTKQDVPETVMIGGKWVLEFKTGLETGSQIELNTVC